MGGERSSWSRAVNDSIKRTWGYEGKRGATECVSMCRRSGCAAKDRRRGAGAVCGRTTVADEEKDELDDKRSELNVVDVEEEVADETEGGRRFACRSRTGSGRKRKRKRSDATRPTTFHTKQTNG